MPPPAQIDLVPSKSPMKHVYSGATSTFEVAPDNEACPLGDCITIAGARVLDLRSHGEQERSRGMFGLSWEINKKPED